MVQLARTLARIGLFLLPTGLGLYLIGSRMVCWNACPPDAPAQLLPWCVDLLVPGMLAGVGAWVVGLSILASQRRWRALCTALFVPGATVGVGRLVLVPATGGEFIGPEALTADLMIWSSLVLIVLLAVLRDVLRLQAAD